MRRLMADARASSGVARAWNQLAIRANWPVLAAVGTLSAVGVITISYVSGYGHAQLTYLVIAIACLVSVQAVNYQALGRWAWPFYFVSLLLVLYTVVGTKLHLPGVAQRNGASAWISFHFITLEPSELMKISFVMVLARYLRFRTNYRTLIGMVPPFALALVPAAIILKQPDLGVAALFLPTLLAMLFVAGAKATHVALILSLLAVLTPLFWLTPLVKPYQRERLVAMFHSDPKTMRETGYQQFRAETAMGSGGVLGKGMGNLPVGRNVPEAYDDMVFSAVGEQFGFMGSLIVLIAYIVLFAAGIEIAAKTREPFGKLVALGIVTLLATQAFLNLMVVTGLFPVTGVTLPFVSYGGSSLVSSYFAAGLLLNIGQNRPLIMAKDAFEFD